MIVMSILPFVIFILALISSIIIFYNLKYEHSNSEKLLMFIILFSVLILIPVHLSAALELFGFIKSASFFTISMFSFALFSVVIAHAYYRQRLIIPNFPAPGTLKIPLKFNDTFGITLFILFFSCLVFSINWLTSHPFGWDAHVYHLPLAVRWLQEESFSIPPNGDVLYSLPANAEVTMFLLLGTGYQAGATAGNILAIVICGLAVYGLTFRVVKNKSASFLAVGLLVSIPMVHFQAFSGYVDLYGTSFILAGLAIFLARHDAHGSMPSSQWYGIAACLAALAWGIGIGTKPTFYPFGLAFYITALVVIWIERYKHKSFLVITTFFTLSISLPCIFWFVRAFEFSGNPIFPFGVEIFGTVLFDGLRLEQIFPKNFDVGHYVRYKWEWLIYPWVEYKDRGYNYGVDSGLGAMWATFVPVGLVYSLYFSLKNKNTKRGKLNIFFFACFIISVILWSLFLGRLPRYGLVIWILACVLTAPFFDLILKVRTGLLNGLIISSVLLTSIVSTLVPAHALLGRIRSSAWERAEMYEYPPLIDRLPKGSVILNLGAPETFNFALAGNELSNRIIPRFWVEEQNLDRVILRYDIDYIVDMSPFCCNELSEVGARLVFEGQVGPTHRWRVWKIKNSQ